MTRRTAAAALVVLAAITLAACGDDPDPGSASTPSSAGGADDGCTTVTVEIPEFAFAPDAVAIEPCDSVVWENTHDQAHTSTGNGDQTWSTDAIAPGSTSPEPVTFAEAGTFSYICALHPYMKGAVVVAG